MQFAFRQAAIAVLELQKQVISVTPLGHAAVAQSIIHASGTCALTTAAAARAKAVNKNFCIMMENATMSNWNINE